MQNAGEALLCRFFWWTGASVCVLMRRKIPTQRKLLKEFAMDV
jgi:hypothetical protein